MNGDIRDKLGLSHEDVTNLNFINNSKYIFRKHYSEGLRSHILQVLDAIDVKREIKGINLDEKPPFPLAKPLRILRIYRKKFESFTQVNHEIHNYKILKSYLAPVFLANSEEFIVDYFAGQSFHMMLCGLQEYVEGDYLNPWGMCNKEILRDQYRSMIIGDNKNVENDTNLYIKNVTINIEKFIFQIKKMICEENLIPDLAGSGNIILTRGGSVKLIDINNISKVSNDDNIYLDDKGYPVCDKSIEAIAKIEQKLLNCKIDKNSPLYKKYLDQKRMAAVKDLDRKFQYF